MTMTNNDNKATVVLCTRPNECYVNVINIINNC